MKKMEQSSSEIDLLGLKSLSKEQRIFFAAEIRKDPELWNPVHGIGGHSESSKNGIIQGTVTDDRVQLLGVKILLVDEKGEKIAYGDTNQYGHYSYELKPGTYTLKINYEEKAFETEITLKKGETASYNYDFKFSAKDKAKERIINDEDTINSEVRTEE